MEAKLHRRGGITVVQLAGKVDLERSQFFRDVCLNQLSKQKVVFCLRNLQFVGSSGIQTLFRAFGEMLEKNPQSVKLAGVKTDFLRVLNYTAVSGLDIHESLDQAVTSFISGRPAAVQAVVEAAFEDADETAADAERNS